MKSKAQRRLVSLAGLLLLSLSVLAMSVQAAQAAPPLVQIQRAHGSFAPLSGKVAAVTGRPATGLPFNGSPALVGRAHVPATVADRTSPAGWIAGGLMSVALLVGVLAYWALGRGYRTVAAPVVSIGQATAPRAPAQSEQSDRRAA